jgi:hypothetical protein
MKSVGLLQWMVFLGGVGVAAAQIPAFVGAEGFGAYAAGGRGGDVYTVVNLNSGGPGSLREGIDTAPAGGRTIVFAVSGYIPIAYNSDTGNQTLRIVRNRVTIAGQTAPGDGIGLKDGRILVTGNNVILRHLRIRHGKYGAAGDCLNLESSADNSIIDHLSLMFSTDENISFFNSAVDDFTMQYSTSSWGMERHNAGGLWDLQDGTCHHSLWAHHRTRNPKARPYGVLEWINNVTFHWRTEGFILGDSQTPADWSANVIGCYFLSIADYQFGLDGTALSKARIASNGEPNFHLYLADCLHDSDGDGVLDGADKGYAIVEGQPYDPLEGAAPGTVRYGRSARPFPGAAGAAAVRVDDPLTAYKKVISSAGALRLDAAFAGPLRDELDTLLIDSVENQESILVQKDSAVSPDDPPSTGEAHLADPPYNISNNGFGTLQSAAAPRDTDGDGMPDFWEFATGSSHTVPDHNAPVPAGAYIPHDPAGYTRLEEYLHFRAIPHAVLVERSASSPSSLSVDLRRYVRGFNVAPVVFALSAIENGSAAMQPDGYTAVFEPETGFWGRAGFEFTVTDGDGSTWTQPLAVLVARAGTIGPPAAPTDLTAVAASSSEIVLNWIDSSPNEIGFAIERSSNGSAFAEIGLVEADVTVYAEVAAPASTNAYRVRAHNLDGYSGYSNTGTAATPAGPPATPASLTAAPGNSRVALDWDPSPGAGRYILRRALSSSGPYVAIATVTDTHFEDLYAINGTPYFYTVSAMGAHGTSAAGPPADALPSAAVTYPAEDASFGGGAVFEDTNAGFLGAGYVNSASDGSYLQFDDVDGGGGGSVSLRFRHALGNTDRTGRLIVNGAPVNITFAGTGAWTAWVDRDIVAALHPGAANFVRLETTGQDLANIDQMTVFGTAVTPPPASPEVDQVQSNGEQLVLRGFGGLPSEPCQVLASTNLLAGAEGWIPIATSLLDANGVFSVTNAVHPDSPQMFFHIEPR